MSSAWLARAAGQRRLQSVPWPSHSGSGSQVPARQNECMRENSPENPWCGQPGGTISLWPTKIRFGSAMSLISAI